MPGGRGTIDSSVHQGRFLECFAACGSVLVASRWAKLSRQAHYNWLKEDPTYRARFEAAEVRAARILEDEAVRRAHQGLRKAIYWKGKVVGYETEYSDMLMAKLLTANNPKKFGDKLALGGNPDGTSVKVVVMDAGSQAPDADPDSES